MSKSLFDKKEKKHPVQTSVEETLWDQVDALRKVKKHKWKDIIKAAFKHYLLNNGDFKA